MSESLVQLLLSGLALGSMYGVVALGYHLTFLSSRSVNFSQGQMVMLGAVVFYTLNVAWGFSVLLAVPATLAVLGALGLVLERIAVRPFLRRESMGWLLSTVAVGIVLENVALLVMGKETRAVPSPLAADAWPVLGARLYPLELLLPFVGIAMLLLLRTVLHSTGLGRAMRAVAFSHDAAKIVGIDPERVNAVAYASSSALAALSGILLAPLLNVSAGMGTMLGLKAFVVAIAGGVENATGIMLAAAACGVVEAVIAGTLGTNVREIAVFGLVIAMLLARPRGLLSSPNAGRA